MRQVRLETSPPPHTPPRVLYHVRRCCYEKKEKIYKEKLLPASLSTADQMLPTFIIRCKNLTSFPITGNFPRFVQVNRWTSLNCQYKTIPRVQDSAHLQMTRLNHTCACAAPDEDESTVWLFCTWLINRTHSNRSEAKKRPDGYSRLKLLYNHFVIGEYFVSRNLTPSSKMSDLNSGQRDNIGSNIWRCLDCCQIKIETGESI